MIGFAAMTIALVWLARTPDDGAFASSFLPGLTVAGLGMGLCLIPLITTVTTGVVDEDQGVVAGVYGMSQQIGGAIGLAVLAGVAASGAAGAGEAHAIRVAILASGIIAVGGAIVCALTLPQRLYHVGHDSLLPITGVPEPGRPRRGRGRFRGRTGADPDPAARLSGGLDAGSAHESLLRWLVVEVRLLGQLQVRGEHGEIPLNGPHVRALFVLLALQPGSVRSRRELARVLWPNRPPTDPGNALQTHVSRLRRQLGVDVIATTQGGYRLDLDPMSIDVARFEAAIARGRRALAEGHARGASPSLDEALELWRGEPFLDVQRFPRLARAAAELADLHAEAVDLRAQSGLMLDDAATVVASLRTQLERHPFREHSYVLLMQALYRMGNQVEALRVGTAAGRVLRERAGLEPGAELREMEQMILNQDPRLAQRSRAPRPAPSSPPVATRSPRSSTPRSGTTRHGRSSPCAERRR